MSAAVRDCALPCSSFFLSLIIYFTRSWCICKETTVGVLFPQGVVMRNEVTYSSPSLPGGLGSPASPVKQEGGTTAGDSSKFALQDQSGEVPASHCLSSAAQPLLATQPLLGEEAGKVGAPPSKGRRGTLRPGQQSPVASYFAD